MHQVPSQNAPQNRNAPRRVKNAPENYLWCTKPLPFYQNSRTKPTEQERFKLPWENKYDVSLLSYHEKPNCRSARIDVDSFFISDFGKWITFIRKWFIVSKYMPFAKKDTPLSAGYLFVSSIPTGFDGGRSDCHAGGIAEPRPGLPAGDPFTAAFTITIRTLSECLKMG